MESKGQDQMKKLTSHLELRFQEGHVQNLTVFVKHFENRPRGGFHFLRQFIVFIDMKIVHKRNLKNFGTIDSVHSNVFLT